MTEAPNFDYAGRVARARNAMEDFGFDVLLASLGSELPYLTGYQAMPLERLTMAVVPRDGDATLVVPELEAPRIERHDDVFDVRAWGETEDPIGIVADLVGSRSRAAIGDRTWSVFLLGLQAALPATKFASARRLTAALRLVKEPAEVDLMRLAAEAVDRVAARLATHQFAGKTERRLSREVIDLTREEGCETVDFAIVASGPNGASPHHEPDDRVIGPGDSVVIDFGGTIQGYHSDTTRTFHVGEPSAAYREVYEVVRAAQAAGEDAVHPGVEAQAVDAVARRIIADAGYGDYFIHRLGHGIGLDVHEDPYLVTGNSQQLGPGMTFSIEPGVYLPGRFGVRIEDIVVCTDDGVDRLNRSPRELVVVS
jgi:Xaa-Pro aminopeptidase